ncbi:MAG: hypothetical protein H2054_07445 [Sphingomonas sp.]|uniref:hypothetical protein n=1 Tax=Sphingomonas sp. TaxID=28214 RepID=UPI00179B1507|nr:hypothetical protein [Sphingomonas sp.]
MFKEPSQFIAVRPGLLQAGTMAHLEGSRANTVDAASAYVAISRARDHASL